MGDAALACFLTGGPTYRIVVAGREWLFELHPYCGAAVISRRTWVPLAVQPRRVLEAASLWAQQGREVGADGLCVWRWPDPELLKHLGGRHYELVTDPAEATHERFRGRLRARETPRG